MHSFIDVSEAQWKLQQRESECHMEFQFESYYRSVNVSQTSSSALTKILKCSEKQAVFEYNVTPEWEEWEMRTDFEWKIK